MFFDEFLLKQIYMFQITCVCVIIVCRKKLIFMNKEEQILKLIEDNDGVIKIKKTIDL